MKTLSKIAVILFLSLALALPAVAETVNINKADQEALQYYLHGIGEVKAKAIVDYRRKHGRFKSIDDLLKVPGVGEATLQKIRRNISLSSGVTKAPKKATGKKSKSVSKSQKGTKKKLTRKTRSKASSKTKGIKGSSKSSVKKTSKKAKSSSKSKGKTTKKKGSTKKKSSKKKRSSKKGAK